MVQRRTGAASRRGSRELARTMHACSAHVRRSGSPPNWQTLAIEDAARIADALVAAEVLRPALPLDFVHPLVKHLVYSDDPAGRARAYGTLALPELLAAADAEPQERSRPTCLRPSRQAEPSDGGDTGGHGLTTRARSRARRTPHTPCTCGRRPGRTRTRRARPRSSSGSSAWQRPQSTVRTGWPRSSSTLALAPDVLRHTRDRPGHLTHSADVRRVPAGPGDPGARLSGTAAGDSAHRARGGRAHQRCPALRTERGQHRIRASRPVPRPGREGTRVRRTAARRYSRLSAAATNQPADVAAQLAERALAAMPSGGAEPSVVAYVSHVLAYCDRFEAARQAAEELAAQSHCAADR